MASPAWLPKPDLLAEFAATPLGRAANSLDFPLEHKLGWLDEIITRPSMKPEYGFLMSAELVIGLTALYFFLIIAIGAIMSKRQAFSLYYFRVFYNAACVAVSLYCAVCFALAAIDGKMGWVCNSDSASPEVARVLMFFYFSKFFEFLDTIIMALRKKICYFSWLWCRYSAGGDVWMGSFLNSTVHTFMYSHYLVTTVGYNTWWKPYLTQMQLLQFCIVVAQMCTQLYFGCGHPPMISWALIAYMGTMLVLFGNFYVQSYLKKKGGDKKATKKDGKAKKEN